MEVVERMFPRCGVQGVDSGTAKQILGKDPLLGSARDAQAGHLRFPWQAIAREPPPPILPLLWLLGGGGAAAALDGHVTLVIYSGAPRALNNGLQRVAFGKIFHFTASTRRRALWKAIFHAWKPNIPTKKEAMKEPLQLG